MRALFTGFLFILATLFVFPAFAADNPVGTFTAVTGMATLARNETAGPQPFKEGDQIHQGDKIETGHDARVTLHFTDDTEIMLGPNGILTVDEYVYDPQTLDASKARYGILNSTFSFLDGKMGQQKNPDIKIDLNFGTLGIRGTRLLRGMRDGKCVIYLQEGSITVSNEGGSVALKPGQMTQMSARDLAPAQSESWREEDAAWIRSELGL